MECTFYQFKTENQCTKCGKQTAIDPEKAVNSLIKDDIGHKHGPKLGNNGQAFRPWCDGELLCRQSL